MISLTFAQLWRISPYRARHELIQTYQRLGSVKATAALLACSKNTVKKWVKRFETSKCLDELSRRPIRQPRKTPQFLEDKVIAIRKSTNMGRKRIARQLKWEHGYKLSSYTIRRILKRNGLAEPVRLRGRFKGARFFRRQHIPPLTYWQVDVKDVNPKVSDPALLPMKAGNNFIPDFPPYFAVR